MSGDQLAWNRPGLQPSKKVTPATVPAHPRGERDDQGNAQAVLVLPLPSPMEANHRLQGDLKSRRRHGQRRKSDTVKKLTDDHTLHIYGNGNEQDRGRSGIGGFSSAVTPGTKPDAPTIQA